MSSRSFAAILGLTVLSGLALAADAQASIRCGNRLVNVGDSVLQLRARCGEPDDVQRFSDLRVLFDDRGNRRERLVEIEEWVYLLGTGDIPRLVRIENGRVRDVQTAPFTALARDGRLDLERCRRQLFSLQQTLAAQVRLTCGLPDQRDRWQDEITTRVQPGVKVRQLITRERWIYNFGENHLIRMFEFANGRLVSMDTGRRGFGEAPTR